MGPVAMADTVAVNPDHPDSYVVQKGDTLWDIAGRFLLEPWRWPDIWHANPQIEDPHLIYPGDVVALRYEDGQPVLTVSRGGAATSGQVISGRNVKLSPTVRSYEKDDAIPAIPVDAIKQFLTQPIVVSESEMDVWPYVVSSYEQHLIAGSGNKVYVRGLPEDAEVARYSIYRQGDALINPRKDEDEILGYEAIYIGDAIIEKFGDPASAVVARSNREILSGDRLREETNADVNTNFIPSVPTQEVQGNILSAIDVVSEIGQYQVVVVDLGENSGMEVGNVLGVYQSGEIVRDETGTVLKANKRCEESLVLEHEDTNAVDRAGGAVLSDIKANMCAFNKSALVGYLGRPNSKPELVELPEEYAGVLMVFRTFDNISFALVMEAVSPIHLYDTVRNL